MAANNLGEHDDINSCRERVLFFYRDLSSYFIDRDEILKLMITATAAQEPMLFVGRPGTAKSLLASVFCQGLGLDAGDYFEYMLTKFTEPSEVMGPVDIKALKDGNFLRKTAGYLPEARVAFLDEIFKANSAILNMLLTILNEKKYYQEGVPLRVPLVMLFAASNEIPDLGDFDALKDRFIIKVETLSVKDTRFNDLIRYGTMFECRRHADYRPWVSDCTLEDFQAINDHLMTVVLPDAIKKKEAPLLQNEEISLQFKALISTLENELGVEVTDRKLIKLYKLIITQAFIFNGGRISTDDMRLLCHCGNNFRDMSKIRERIGIYLDNL